MYQNKINCLSFEAKSAPHPNVIGHSIRWMDGERERASFSVEEQSRKNNTFIKETDGKFCEVTYWGEPFQREQHPLVFTLALRSALNN